MCPDIHFLTLPPSGFIGNADFALSDVSSVPYGNALFQWYWVFCAASTTILVGSMAERCTFISYVIFTAFYACWVSDWYHALVTSLAASQIHELNICIFECRCCRYILFQRTGSGQRMVG